MRTIALRGLWGRKLRTILTGFAIVRDMPRSEAGAVIAAMDELSAG